MKLRQIIFLMIMMLIVINANAEIKNKIINTDSGAPFILENIYSPFNETIINTASVNIEGMVSDPTASVLINGIKAEISETGQFIAYAVPLSEGNNKIDVIATNKQGKSSSLSRKLIYKPIKPIPPQIMLSITSPEKDKLLIGPTTTIAGNYSSTADEAWIKVNDTIALTFGNQFVANDISLKRGSNRVVIYAQDSSGAIGRVETVVKMNIGKYVKLVASSTDGTAPLTTFFTLNNETNNELIDYQIDFEGNGITTSLGKSFDNITYTYNKEGIFYPQITVKDNQGNIYTDKIAIVVPSKQQLENVLKTNWRKMTEALISGDEKTALSYFLPGKQEEYKKIFKDMGIDKIKKIFSKLSDLHLTRNYGQDASCNVTRIEEGKAYSYPVKFVRNYDGIWKIFWF